jgi:hypothetical protein
MKMKRSINEYEELDDYSDAMSDESRSDSAIREISRKVFKQPLNTESRDPATLSVE